jgi:lysyl-tRNA synthetase class 1
MREITGGLFGYVARQIKLPNVDPRSDTPDNFVRGHDCFGDAEQRTLPLQGGYNIEPGDLFAAGYQLFFGRSAGPRLGPFLASLETAFVTRRLRREG